jgi:hypothetical protein
MIAARHGSAKFKSPFEIGDRAVQARRSWPSRNCHVTRGAQALSMPEGRAPARSEPS